MTSSVFGYIAIIITVVAAAALYYTCQYLLWLNNKRRAHSLTGKQQAYNLRLKVRLLLGLPTDKNKTTYR